MSVAMIRASELYGRVLVDLDTAEKVGNIAEIIVDPYAPCIAGYVVTCGRTLLGGGQRTLMPSEAVHAIGPDALTVRHAAEPSDLHTHLDALPRLSELTGRRMVSHGGRLLGTIEDALIDERDGRIVGYPLDANGLTSGLDRLFTLGLGSGRLEYVRADADLRVGAKLVVVPDEAIVAVDDESVPADPALEMGSCDSSAQTTSAETSSRPEPRRRTVAARRAAIAIAPPPVELVGADPGPATGVSEGILPHDDVDDTTQIPVQAGRRRHASGAR